MQHGFKTQHSTVTALHILNYTIAKGFNQMAPHTRPITVALDMSKAFDTINIHTLIRKLLQTNIPCTIIKFIRDEKPTQHIETTHPDNVNLPTLFNIYTSDVPPPNAPVQIMAYADDITITSIHTSTSSAK